MKAVHLVFQQKAENDKDFEKYLVFYCFSDDTIQILRVIHGARDYPLLFEN